MMKRNEQTETRFFKICIYVILGVTLIYFVAWQLTHPRNATIDNNSFKVDSKLYTGTLCGYEEGCVSIECGGKSRSFDKSQLAQVRLHVKIS